MRNDAAFASISLVVSVFMLASCTAGREIIFIDADETGEGGASTTHSGAGGSILVGSSSSGMSSSGSSSGSSSASSSSSSSGTIDPPVDCANIPKGPFSYKVKYGQKASEDMDFDNLGNLIGAENGNLFKSTFNGNSQIWVPGGGDFIAGMRFTSNGVLVYANVSANSLFKVVQPGIKSFVIGGLAYPNGMDADNSGRIAVAEQSASQLRRVHPDTGESEILASNLNNPNGVSYAPDYKSVYVGSFGGGTIYKITLDAQDKPVSQGVFISGFTQTGSFDGMGVDACGNVYVCEYGPAKVWRVPPSGQNPELVVDLGGETGWIPNMQWGSGIAGWDPLVLYVRDISSEKMYEVPVGVPTKPRKYP